MSKNSILYLVDYKTKTIEFVECEDATFRGIDDKTMLFIIKGGSCDGDRLIIGGWGRIDVYNPKDYKGFKIGEIARVPIDEVIIHNYSREIIASRIENTEKQ